MIEKQKCIHSMAGSYISVVGRETQRRVGRKVILLPSNRKGNAEKAYS
jgi:hypothetical protein